MYENFGWKFSLIFVVVILSSLALYFFDIKKGMDLQGGTELLYQIDVSRLDENQRQKIQDQAKEVLERRLNILGLQDIKIREAGRYGISIQIPVTMDKQRVRRIVERSGKLMFKLLHKRYNDVKDIIDSDPNFMDSPNLSPADRDWIRQKIAEIERKKKEGTYNEDEDPLDTAVFIYWKKDAKGRILKDKSGRRIEIARRIILLENTPESRVSGNLLRDAYPTTDNMGRRAVGFEFSSVGADLFRKLTGKNKGRRLAIVLDGQIRSMPVIQAQIGARGIIQGHFTKEEIRELVVVLKAGALPAKLIVPPSELSTGPGLGKEAIERGWLASITGLLVICVFMIFYYHFLGIVANIALFLNLLLILAVLAFYHAFLTLPGIAGIVLTVGMSVDANILIYERIREELARGKSLRHAVSLGYDRAFWAIFDANITTVIAAAILFSIGTGPVKGFAVTLSIGVLTSMFTALFVTRAILGFLIVKKKVQKLTMKKLLSNPNIPFLKYRRLAPLISFLLILLGMGYLFFLVKGDILGIDFTGGTLIHVKFKRPVTVEEVKNRLQGIPSYQDAEIQAVSSGEVAGVPGSREFQIRVRVFVNVNEPLYHYVSPKEARIAFVYKLKRGKREPFSIDIKRDLVNKLKLPVEKVIVIRKVTEEIKKLFGVQKLNPMYYTVGILTKPLPVKSEEFRLDALRSHIEEYLEARYTIVREAVQELLSSVFEDLLNPPGFILPPEEKRFIEDKEGKGKIRFWVNLEVKGISEEAIQKALLSPEFEAELKKRHLSVFDKALLEVKIRKNGNYSPYVKGYEIVAGPVSKAEEPLYRAALREFFQKSSQFMVSEPFPQVTSIGSAVAKNLKAKAFWAILFSLFAILAYITIRFELVFAFGAVMALAHDLFMTLGIIAIFDYHGLLNIKINLPLIAAFLTILGYSLNDTIVVFDRIRENLQLRRRKEDFLSILNSSLNQTLSRTVLTSITTLLAVVILFLAAVEELEGFTFALLCGVIVGTYSSIFIATPVVVYFHEREKRLREARREQAKKK